MESFVSNVVGSASRHKSEVVTELGIDNLSFLFGVYGNVALALFIVVQGTINDQIVCRPGDASLDEFRQVEKYVSQYCWAADDRIENGNGTCDGAGNVNWDGDGIDSKLAVDQLPKIVLLFAMLYLIPHYYWEYYCGGTLAGYLSHLKNLITAIKNKCETVPESGVYGGKHITAASLFDPDSSTFATSRKYKRYWVADDFKRKRKPKKPNKINDTVALEVTSVKSDEPLIDKDAVEMKEKEDIENQNYALKEEKKKAEQVEKSSCLGPKMLRDYHFFALLCWRNFATLPELTMIESVQRLVAAKKQDYVNTEKVLCPDGVERNLTFLEKSVLLDETQNMGMLWCVTKMFVHEKNFQGRELLKSYRNRLVLTVVIAALSLVVSLYVMSYYTVLGDNLVEDICCKITTNTIQREYSCFLPTTGDLPQLVIGFVVIQSIIILMNFYQFYKFYIHGKSDMMEMAFIEKFIDDPLSYCPLWNPVSHYSGAMAKIVDSEDSEPQPPVIKLPDELSAYLKTVTRELTEKKEE